MSVSSGNVALAKFAVNVFAGLGVSKVCMDIINNNANIVTTADKVLTKTGSIVLGVMAGEQTTRLVDKYIDNLISWNENRNKDVVSDEAPVKAKAS